MVNFLKYYSNCTRRISEIGKKNVGRAPHNTDGYLRSAAPTHLTPSNFLKAMGVLVLSLTSCGTRDVAEKICIRKMEIFDRQQFEQCTNQELKRLSMSGLKNGLDPIQEEMRVDCLNELDAKYPGHKDRSVYFNQCLENKGYYYVR